MTESLNRERKNGMIDKKRSFINYMKLDDQNENKVNMIKKAVDSNVDMETMVSEKMMQLPSPPNFSYMPKVYENKDSGTSRIFIHERATIINNFDQFEIINCELSLINLENYLSKFEEDELSSLTVQDILTFDIKEFDNIKNKLVEFKAAALKLNDNDMLKFLNEKIVSVDMNKQVIDLLIHNMEKVEDFVVLNETLKFFFKKIKK